jgi:hypothetical protein
MKAIITRRRWNATHADYKTGSPQDVTARMLRFTSDKGTVCVSATVVGRDRFFDLGQIVITPGALAVLEGLAIHPALLIARHAQGDWGDLASDDHDANDDALRTGARLLVSTNCPIAPDCGSSRRPRWIRHQQATALRPDPRPRFCSRRCTEPGDEDDE